MLKICWEELWEVIIQKSIFLSLLYEYSNMQISADILYCVAHGD